MNFFDFVICELFTGKQVDFFHFNWAIRNSIFPFFDFTLEQKLVGETVPHQKSSFATDLVVNSLSIPFINQGWVDLLESGFGW